MSDEFTCPRGRVEAFPSIDAYCRSRDAAGLARMIWDDTHQRNVFASYRGNSGDHSLAVIAAARDLPPATDVETPEPVGYCVWISPTKLAACTKKTVNAFPVYTSYNKEMQDKWDVLHSAVDGIGDDYMTSEHHHPGYVLIPTAKFEAIRSALAAVAEGSKP